MEAMYRDNVLAEPRNSGSRRTMSGTGGRTNRMMYGVADMMRGDAPSRMMRRAAMDNVAHRHVPRRPMPRGDMRMHRWTRGVRGRRMRSGMAHAASTTGMCLLVRLGNCGHCKDDSRKKGKNAFHGRSPVP